jgi:hypothetical protein
MLRNFFQYFRITRKLLRQRDITSGVQEISSNPHRETNDKDRNEEPCYAIRNSFGQLAETHQTHCCQYHNYSNFLNQNHPF